MVADVVGGVCERGAKGGFLDRSGARGCQLVERLGGRSLVLALDLQLGGEEPQVGMVGRELPGRLHRRLGLVGRLGG